MKMTQNLLEKTNRALLLAAGFFFCLAAHLPAEPKIAKPSKFKVGYSVDKAASGGAFGAPGLFSGGAVASVAVNILDERFYPVRTFVLRDVKNKNRVESLWDGRDVYGKEMPAGNYYASLSIVYSDDTRESKFFKFIKE